MRAVWFPGVLLAGCMTTEIPHEDPTVIAQSAPCTSLEGSTYRSVHEGECGLGPNGPTSCPWNLTFRADTETRSRFDWGHSDVAESGYVSCDGTTIQTVTSSASDVPLYDGIFDPSTGDLVWDDAAYTLTP